jgi:hypothetical protein
MMPPRQLPAPLADPERFRYLEAGDDYARQHFKDVVKAITDEARKGNKTCQELYMKYLAQPMREERKEAVQRASASARQLPPVLNIALVRLSGNLGLKPPQSKVIDVSPSEPAALPVADGTESSAATAPVLSPDDPHVKKCETCGQLFRTSQPRSAKFCVECRKARSLKKLLDRKAELKAKRTAWEKKQANRKRGERRKRKRVAKVGGI